MGVRWYLCRYPIDPWIAQPNELPSYFLSALSWAFALFPSRSSSAVTLTEFHLQKSNYLIDYWTSVTPPNWPRQVQLHRSQSLALPLLRLWGDGGGVSQSRKCYVCLE